MTMFQSSPVNNYKAKHIYIVKVRKKKNCTPFQIKNIDNSKKL